MGKLFCLPVFSRKAKAAKAATGSEAIGEHAVSRKVSFNRRLAHPSTDGEVEILFFSKHIAASASTRDGGSRDSQQLAIAVLDHHVMSDPKVNGSPSSSAHVEKTKDNGFAVRLSQHGRRKMDLQGCFEFRNMDCEESVVILESSPHTTPSHVIPDLQCDEENGNESGDCGMQDLQLMPSLQESLYDMEMTSYNSSDTVSPQSSVHNPVLERHLVKSGLVEEISEQIDPSSSDKVLVISDYLVEATYTSEHHHSGESSVVNSNSVAAYLNADFVPNSYEIQTAETDLVCGTDLDIDDQEQIVSVHRGFENVTAEQSGLDLNVVECFGFQPVHFPQCRVQEWLDSVPGMAGDYDEMATHTFHALDKLHVQDSTEATLGNDPLNAAARSLSVLSTVAHLAGIGLREMPSLGMFNNLKTLNISANSIGQVPGGCLPRGLLSLDLSRNKMVLIDGLKDLTRLRILNLSHNRIVRIGQGLANCVLIKELYLGGNKLSEVEGLHRLLKLSLLDLSWNKLATSKAVGQLAANYSSLLALNLLGNPVVSNVGDEYLKRLVSSLTPHVIYLNKQPIKAVSIRTAAVDNIARAALGAGQRCGRSAGTRLRMGAQVAKKVPSQRRSKGQKRVRPVM